AMLHGDWHERPAVDHKQGAVNRRRGARWLVGRFGVSRATRDLWPRAAFEVDVAVDFQVVDPNIDLAWRAVSIENDQIDERFARIDLGAELRAKDAGFLIEQAADVSNAELLPLPDIGVHVAPEQRGDWLAGAAIDVARKHDTRHELQTRPVGFDKQRGSEFLNKRRAADRMHQRQESAVADGQTKMLAGLAAVRLAKWTIMREHANAAVGLF